MCFHQWKVFLMSTNFSPYNKHEKHAKDNSTNVYIFWVTCTRRLCVQYYSLLYLSIRSMVVEYNEKKNMQNILIYRFWKTHMLWIAFCTLHIKETHSHISFVSRKYGNVHCFLTRRIYLPFQYKHRENERKSINTIHKECKYCKKKCLWCSKHIVSMKALKLLCKKPKIKKKMKYKQTFVMYVATSKKQETQFRSDFCSMVLNSRYLHALHIYIALFCISNEIKYI